MVSNKQNLEKDENVVSNNKIEFYSDEENSNNYDEENFEKFYSDDSCNEDSDGEKSDDSDDFNDKILMQKVKCKKLFLEIIIFLKK